MKQTPSKTHYIVIWQSLILKSYRSIFCHLAEIIKEKSSISLVIPEKFTEGAGQKLVCEPLGVCEKSLFASTFITPVWTFHIQGVWFRGLWKFFKTAPAGTRKKILCIAEPYSLTALWCYSVARLKFGKNFAFFPYTAQNILKKFPWPLSDTQKFILNRSAAVLVCGNTQKEILRKINPIVPIISFPLWFDESLFFDHKIKPDYFITIGFAGSLVEEKGILNFLEIIPVLKAEFSNVKFKIAGHGLLQTLVITKAKELDIEFCGSVAPSQMPIFFSSLDILVVPSQTRPHWREQFGRVIVEALACGTSVIGSDSGEIPFVVEDESAIFAENDKKDLLKVCRAKINQVGENTKSIRNSNSNRALEKYSAEHLARKLASQLVFENDL